MFAQHVQPAAILVAGGSVAKFYGIRTCDVLPRAKIIFSRWHCHFIPNKSKVNHLCFPFLQINCLFLSLCGLQNSRQTCVRVVGHFNFSNPRDN